MPCMWTELELVLVRWLVGLGLDVTDAVSCGEYDRFWTGDVDRVLVSELAPSSLSRSAAPLVPFCRVLEFKMRYT